MECFLSDLTSVVITTPIGEKIELEKDFNINGISGEVTRRWVRYGPKDGALPDPGDYIFSYWRHSELVYEQSVAYDSGVISYPTGVEWSRVGQDIVVDWIPPPEASMGMHYKVLIWPIKNSSENPISQKYDWDANSGVLKDVPLIEGVKYSLNVAIYFSDGYAYSNYVIFEWPTLTTGFKPSLEERYEVSVEEAVAYGTGGTINGGQIELLLDLAVPDTGIDGPRPLLVHIHGGGFTGGSRFPQWDAAKRGWVAASIDYRLVGDEYLNNPLPSSRVQGLRDAVDETLFPKWLSVVAAVEDTLVAIDYLLSRADELAIDTDRIVLQGFSAGAFTALHVAYCTDEFGISRPTIAAVINFSGAISKACGEGAAIDPGEAAMFVVHGTEDTGSTSFTRALSVVDGATTAGITYEFHPLEGVGHTWDRMKETTADGRTIDDAMYEFLGRVLYSRYWNAGVDKRGG